jgi:ankyrin repeat protein
MPFDLHERLCMAAQMGPVERIWALVNEGADVDRPDAEGLTALHYAAYRGNVETVRVILELGVDANAQFIR